MTDHESFASKLVSGTATASRMASWWPRHCRATGDYLSLFIDGADFPQVKAAKDRMLALASEWSLVVPAAARRRAGAIFGVMTEHASFEMDFIEAAALADLPAIDRIPERLLGNAKTQGTRYGHVLKDFPERRFTELMRDHIALFVEAVTRRIEKDKRGMAVCAEMIDANALALATISAEWF